MLITLAERRMLPDAVIRTGIRRILEQRLYREREAMPTDATGRRDLMRQQFATGPIAEETDAVRRQHDEAPTELFLEMLGPRLNHSGCHWGPGVDDLAGAEEEMLALICERAGIADGQRILDLGCGWGALTFWMAERYPNADIVAASNSRMQHRFIMEQALLRGMLNVRHIVLNVADFAHEEVDGAAPDLGDDWRFDRIVSIEMFERIRNVERLLQHLAGWLAVEGKLFVQLFCHRDLFYRFHIDGQNDWMARHFFAGVAMPSLDLFDHVRGPFRLDNRWEVGGEHYARTSRAWLDNLDAAGDDVLQRFRQDLAPAAARRQVQRWRMFVMACEELFAYDAGRQWLVSHHLLARS